MIQIKNLTAWWRDLDADIKSKELEFRRLKALEKWLLQNVPDYITGKYSFDAMGDSCIRCFIRLDKDETSTVSMLKWLPVLKKQGWNIEKFWRKADGFFSYKAEKKFKNNCCLSYLLFFEETANIDGCVIVKKEEIQTIYTTDCERESVIL